MGQKIQANGFRLGVNKTWKSRWFATGVDYRDQLLQDIKVREFIKEKVKSAGVETIIIKRSINKISVDVKVARPGMVVGRGGAGIEALKKEVSRLLQSKVELTVSEVASPDLSSSIVAQRIAEAIEHRAIPKIAVMKEMEKIKAAGAKGVKIWISGCIRGASIARTDKFDWGTVPLQTLRADIDFAREAAQTVRTGILGVKVWIYKGEKLDIDRDE